jgi:hypothetical protein
MGECGSQKKKKKEWAAEAVQGRGGMLRRSSSFTSFSILQCRLNITERDT